MKYLYYVLFMSLFFSLSLLSQENIQSLKSQINEKSNQLSVINSNFEDKNSQHRLLVTEYEKTKAKRENKEKERDKAKNTYDRAQKNIDIISPENLSKLLKEYQDAIKEYKNAKEKEDELINQKNILEAEVEGLRKQKQEKEIEILQIQANLYDLELSKPVWAEGYGESILDEDKSMKECKRLALEYARRDAEEKGGKMLIESTTEIENFMLTKDQIKTRAKVQIIDQDDSNDYGKAIRVDQGDVIKFTAKVRLKLKSVDTYNPFRNRINEIQSKIQNEKNAEIVNNLCQEAINNYKSAFSWEGHPRFIEPQIHNAYQSIKKAYKLDEFLLNNPKYLGLAACILCSYQNYGKDKNELEIAKKLSYLSISKDPKNSWGLLGSTAVQEQYGNMNAAVKYASKVNKSEIPQWLQTYLDWVLSHKK